jgi:hypothetical protein
MEPRNPETLWGALVHLYKDKLHCFFNDAEKTIEFTAKFLISAWPHYYMNI